MIIRANKGAWGMGFRNSLAVLAVSMMVATPVLADPAPAPIAANTLAPLVDPILAKWMADEHVPGLVFGVVDHGRLAYVRAMGVQDLAQKRPVNADTLFRIASMTKAFTALSILSLRDKGLVSLDDPAEKYVPEMKGWAGATADAPRITVRDLLHHVAGFVTDDPWGDRQTELPQDKFTALLAAGVPYARAPEMAYEYSNMGYAILGRIIANVTHAPYRNYVETTLLKPLGMTASGFNVHELQAERRALGYRFENGAWSEEPTLEDGAFNSMGGLSVSATDYAKWLGFVLSAWPPRDDADAGPVRRGTVRQVVQGLNFQVPFRRYGASGATACPGAMTYGMGWRVVQDCDFGLVFHHSGGYPGYGSHVMMLPEFGVALFMLTNRTYAGPSPAVWDSAVAMLGAGMLHRQPLPTSPDLAKFAGLARDVWAAGSVAPIEGKVSMNFFLDRTPANWARVLAALKAKAGACDTSSAVQPQNAMTGVISWTCAHGRITGRVLLAPTRPTTLQALDLDFVP